MVFHDYARGNSIGAESGFLYTSNIFNPLRKYRILFHFDGYPKTMWIYRIDISIRCNTLATKCSIFFRVGSLGEKGKFTVITCLFDDINVRQRNAFWIQILHVFLLWTAFHKKSQDLVITWGFRPFIGIQDRWRSADLPVTLPRDMVLLDSKQKRLFFTIVMTFSK